MSDIDSLRRRERDNEGKERLFESGENVYEHWWDMPQYSHVDARPQYKIVVHFHTLEDVVEFGRRLDVKVGGRTRSLLFPHESIDKPSEWEYHG